jgi:hypothetical protein
VSDRFGWLASVTGGALLWIAAGINAGGREPWDVGSYWTIYLPAAYLLCGVLGFAFPVRTWRWPLAVMLMQLPVMAVTTTGVGSLFVIGIILLLALSLPGMITAGLGAAARRWAAA